MVLMWMEFKCEARFLVEPLQPFCRVVAPVLLGAQTLGKLFLGFFNHGLHRPHGSQKNAQPEPFDPGCAGELSTIDYVLVVTSVTAEARAWVEASVSAVTVV
jgi:hypothetical protein